MPYDVKLDEEQKKEVAAQEAAQPEVGGPEPQPQPQQEAAEAAQQPDMKSRFTIRSLEDLGRYVAGESIPVAVELEGIPRDCIRVEYSAECIDAGGEQQWDISQVELDETGHGKDDWTVHTGEVGRYLIEVRMTDGSGLTQAQQVLIEVVVPDGPSQAAADSAAEAPKSQGADQKDKEVAVAT